jgi:GDP-4-dehydro-6-deoxy-D-mannose reductase
MNCLITGCTGLIGPHLAEYLLSQDVTVFAAYHSAPDALDHLRDQITLLPCDIFQPNQVREVLERSRPDRVFHLAAQSHPAKSWQDPEGTLHVNLLGTLNLLNELRRQNSDCLALVFGSSAEYGRPLSECEKISETFPLRPESPYGVSKVAAELLSNVYARAYGIRIIHLRPFFVVGPGRASNVCTDFAMRITEIELGLTDSLGVGNLAAVRDFVDVRDAARAIWVIAEKGVPGEIYNLCCGQGHAIQEVLDHMLAMAANPIHVYTDSEKFRPLDTPILIGDGRKLQELGWMPEIPFHRSLADILNFWRGQAKKGNPARQDPQQNLVYRSRV